MDSILQQMQAGSAGGSEKDQEIIAAFSGWLTLQQEIVPVIDGCLSSSTGPRITACMATALPPYQSRMNTVTERLKTAVGQN